MVTYICTDCDKVFKNKNFFVKHQNRKFPCKKTNSDGSKIHQNVICNTNIDSNALVITSAPDKINKKNDHECSYCKKQFSKSSNLYRHVKENCKIKTAG